MNDAAQQIKHFNAGRDPERLALKLGKMRAEGKEYVVQDGDVMNFLFNV